MKVDAVRPHPGLCSIVKEYSSRTADLGHTKLRVALPARTNTFIEFYFATPHAIEIQKTGLLEDAPWNVVVGPQTHRRVDLILTGRIDAFTITFRPTGLHTLFGVPLQDLVDAGIHAEHLFGLRASRDLHDRLAGLTTLQDRARCVDGFLLNVAARRAPSSATRMIARAAVQLQRSAGRAPLPSLVPAGLLSERQLRRQFDVQIGMSPKRYARVIRLGAAIQAKTRDPRRSWADIAHEFGWFDQAHLDKDFRELAGSTPSAFPIGPRVEL